MSKICAPQRSKKWTQNKDIGENLVNISFAAKVYNTFGEYTDNKSIIRELIACGCYL
jgi:hypothetical protein